MSFGQQSGPPASPKQLAYLKSLLAKEGFDDFRTARRTFDLTQRQSSGKFTSKEASALIDRLLGNEPAETQLAREPEVPDKPDAKWDAQLQLVRALPGDVLADELRRRGWQVTEPS